MYPSVTSRGSIKTAEQIITEIASHGSLAAQFLYAKRLSEIELGCGVICQMGLLNTHRIGKIYDFQQITRYKIDT